MKASILIIEDERIVAKDIALTLESLGYSIAGTAPNGEDAILLAKEKRPDLVLMDIKLKGKMDGIEAADEIYRKFNIPVVFLTAFTSDLLLERAKKSNAFGYLVKPFDEKSLDTTIQITLNKKLEMEKKFSAQGSKAGLDLFDKKILCEMLKNCRASASEIGRKVRLSKGLVNYRIKKLVENGNINKCYALVNCYLLGYQYYKISISFGRTTPEIENEIVDYVSKDPACFKFCVTEGAFSISLFSIYREAGQLRKFLEKFSSNFGDYIMEKEICQIISLDIFNHKFFTEEGHFSSNPKICSVEAQGKCPSIDEKDSKILRALAYDARIGLVELSKKLGIDWKIIKYRIRKMEKAGLIPAYTADLNVNKLGEQTVQVSMSLRSTSLIPSIREFFNNTNTCVFAYEMLGNYDFMAELVVRDEEALKAILGKFQSLFSKNYFSYDVAHISRAGIVNPFPSH